MIVFEIVLLSLAGIYALSILYLMIGFYRMTPGSSLKVCSLSVVIAAHNEEDSIGKCLESIAAQDYPDDKYEVIIADDRSNDLTSEIIERFCSARENFTSVRVEEGEDVVPKKTALLKALAKAKGEIIVSTDADCVAPKGWLGTLNSCFSKEIGMIVGHAAYPKPKNLWGGIDALDYFSQRAMGAAFVGVGSAYTCTAANLAYRKVIYDELEADFSKLKVRPAEDNFLLNFIHRNTDYSIALVTSEQSIVTTGGAGSLTHFLNQRFRWGAYGDSLVSPGMMMFFVPALLLYGMIWLTAAGLLMYPELATTLAVALGVKAVADYLFLSKSTAVYGCRYLLKHFLPAWLTNLILVPVIVVRSNLFPFEWKGRKFNHNAEVEK